MNGLTLFSIPLRIYRRETGGGCLCLLNLSLLRGGKVGGTLDSWSKACDGLKSSRGRYVSRGEATDTI